MKACNTKDVDAVKTILPKITPSDLLKAKTSDRGHNILQYMSYEGDIEKHEITELIVEHFHKENLLTTAALAKDKHQKTALHWTCYNSNYALLNQICSKLSSESIRNAFLEEDDQKKTVLHNACENVPSKNLSLTVLQLLKLYSNSLPHGTQKENNTSGAPLSLEAQKQNLKEWVTLIAKEDENGNKPFQLADSCLMEELLEEVDLEEEWDEIGKFPWVLILAQKNKFGFSSFNYEVNVKKIVEIFNMLFEEKVELRKTLEECFPEFTYHIKCKRFLDVYVNNPIYVLANSEKLALIKHPYIQAYVGTCWKSRWVYLPFCAYVLMYFLFLVGLCCYTNSHIFTVVSSTFRNISMDRNDSAFVPVIEYIFSSWHPQVTTFGLVVVVGFATLGIIYEFIQMYNMRWHYFKIEISRDHVEISENYADLVIFPGALIITIAPFLTGYNSWVHGFACVLIIVTAYRGVLLLTHVPVLGTKFLMLTAGVKRVLYFSPILLFFVVMFAIVFENLLQKKESFSHLGFAFMKVITMSIGEVEFNDTFFDASHHEPFVILAFLLLLVFIAIITISMMNLLIGITVGDIKKLQQHAEQTEFKSKVELICTVLYIFRTQNMIHMKKLHEIRKIRKESDDQLRVRNNEFINDLEKEYKTCTTNDDDTEKLLKRMLRNQLDQRKTIKSIETKQNSLRNVIATKQTVTSFQTHITTNIANKQNAIQKTIDTNHEAIKKEIEALEESLHENSKLEDANISKLKEHDNDLIERISALESLVHNELKTIAGKLQNITEELKRGK